MTGQVPISNSVRSELVDLATGFLKNPKIAIEQMERKREFLQKKGLTDTEINYAFQLIPQQETSTQIISDHQPSFLRRFLNDLAFAGFLVLVIKIIKESFRSNQLNQTNELNETIKNLQKTVGDMQTSVVKLEQTADQLNLTMKSPTTSLGIEEINREIQILKGLFLNRSQFSQIPSTLSSWQSETTETIKPTTSIDNQTVLDKDESDGIIVISEQDKKSNDENLSSNDN